LENNIHVFFLRAGNSDNDQPNDNGPNSALKGIYGKYHDRFFSGVDSGFIRVQQMSIPIFNQIFLSAWEEFKLEGKVVKRAFEKTGLHPLNRKAVNYNKTAVCLSSLYTGVVEAAAVHDPSDATGLASISALPPLSIQEHSAQLVLSSPEAQSKQIVIRKAVLDLVCAPSALNAAQIHTVNQNFKRAKNNSISTNSLNTESGLQVTSAVIAKLRQNQEKKDQEAETKKAKSDERDAKSEAKVRERAAAWDSFNIFNNETDLACALNRAKVDDVRLALEHFRTSKEDRSTIRKMKKSEAAEAMIDALCRGTWRHAVSPARQTSAPTSSEQEGVCDHEEHVADETQDTPATCESDDVPAPGNAPLPAPVPAPCEVLTEGGRQTFYISMQQ